MYLTNVYHTRQSNGSEQRRLKILTLMYNSLARTAAPSDLMHLLGLFTPGSLRSAAARGLLVVHRMCRLLLNADASLMLASEPSSAGTVP